MFGLQEELLRRKTTLLASEPEYQGYRQLQTIDVPSRDFGVFLRWLCTDQVEIADRAATLLDGVSTLEEAFQLQEDYYLELISLSRTARYLGCEGLESALYTRLHRSYEDCAARR